VNAWASHRREEFGTTASAVYGWLTALEYSTLMAEAYFERQRLLPQRSFTALHLLNNLCDRRFSFRVLP
jgi:hypothetical protein